MPSRSDIPLTKHTVRMFEGDLTRLGVLFPSLGQDRALRLLTRNFIRRIEQGLSPIDIDLPISADEAKELIND